MVEERINFITAGAADIIRTAYYIHGPEWRKLIFAVLYVSRTMGLTRCYKTDSFCTFMFAVFLLILCYFY